MDRLAFISGVSGLTLTDKERDFFKETAPLGLILFGRNIETADQVKALVDDVRSAVGDEYFWVLIDQEGGRVQRLMPPLFPKLPAARRYGELYEKDPRKALFAVQEIGKLMAQRLRALGINVNCTPVLDVAQPDAHEIIGDRSFGSDTDMIIDLARRHAHAHMLAGVLPVIKHIPGHGRANVDSHHGLPIIDTPLPQLREVDFEPFRRLNEMPLAMTAHVVFKAIDGVRPVSASTKVIAEIVRNELDFEGFLMCDDVSMEALDGTIAERTRAVIGAGCDGALHCNGIMEEMIDVAKNVPVLADYAAARFYRSFSMIENAMEVDETDALALLSEDWTGLTV